MKRLIILLLLFSTTLFAKELIIYYGQGAMSMPLDTIDSLKIDTRLKIYPNDQ
jgi:hypothetical protein